MHENGKMRHVETIPGKGGGRINVKMFYKVNADRYT
jgi:hypothetical protein